MYNSFLLYGGTCDYVNLGSMAFNLFLEHVYGKSMVKYACQAGRSYLELLLMRLRWAQLGLIQNLQALATVDKRRIDRAPSILEL